MIRDKVDFIYQVIFTKPIEFLITFREVGPIEKIFAKLFHCQKKKKFMRMYYRIHQRAMFDLIKIIKELEIESEWKYSYEFSEADSKNVLEETLYSDLHNNFSITINCSEIVDLYISRQSLKVKISDGINEVSESFFSRSDYLEEPKERIFNFDSDEARGQSIHEGLLGCFYSICERFNQCP